MNCEQYWHCHANPPASSRWTDNRNKSFKFFHQAPPSMCLPSVCLTKPHMTKSPRPSPSVFAYCKLSDLILEMGMAWKWGYRLHAPFCNNKIYSHCSHQQYTTNLRMQSVYMHGHDCRQRLWELYNFLHTSFQYAHTRSSQQILPWKLRCLKLNMQYSLG